MLGPIGFLATGGGAFFAPPTILEAFPPLVSMTLVGSTLVADSLAPSTAEVWGDGDWGCSPSATSLTATIELRAGGGGACSCSLVSSSIMILCCWQQSLFASSKACLSSETCKIGG